jgi:hypothetical protein
MNTSAVQFNCSHFIIINYLSVTKQHHMMLTMFSICVKKDLGHTKTVNERTIPELYTVTIYYIW